MLIKLKPRKCKFCKAEFEPRTTWQQFCQRKCRTTYTTEKHASLIRRAQKIIESQRGAA